MADSFMKRHITMSSIIAVVIALFGIFMMFQGDAFTKAFVVLIGVGIVVSGINSLLSLRVYSFGPRNKGALLIKALLSLAVGVLVIALSLSEKKFSTNLLLYILAAQLLFSAFVSAFQAFFLRKGNISVAPLLSEALFSLVLALLFTFFPSQIGSLLLKLVGVVLFSAGVAMFIWAKRMKHLTKDFNLTLEGEVEEIGESTPHVDNS